MHFAFENVSPITDLWEGEEDAFPLLGYSTYTSRKVSVIGKEGTVYEVKAVVQFLHQSMRQSYWQKTKHVLREHHQLMKIYYLSMTQISLACLV